MAIKKCPYCKAMIDESAEFCTNCGTKLLFPEDEMIEEDIPGEKVLEVDMKEKTSNTARKRKPRKKKTAPKKKKEKEIKAADTGRAEEVEIIDDEKEISEKTEISEPDDNVEDWGADLEGKPAAEEEDKGLEELGEEDVKLPTTDEDIIDEPEESQTPDEEWDVDENIKEIDTEELSNFGEEKLPGEPPDETEDEAEEESLEGPVDEIIEEPSEEAEEEVIEEEEDAMLFPEEIMKEPGTADEDLDFKTEDLEKMVDPAEKEKEDIESFLDSLKKERQEIKDKAAEEGEGEEELPPRATEIEESDSTESTYDEEEIPDEMPQEDKDLYEAEDIPAEEPPPEIETESVLSEALEQPSFEFSGFPAKKKKEERRKFKSKRAHVKIIAVLKTSVFDILFVAAFWFISVWAASFLTSVSVFQLISDSVLPTIAFFIILLAIYFSLFLVFLGETLGNLIFSKKD